MTCGALDGKLAELKHGHRAVLKERKKLEEELEARRHELEALQRRLQAAEERLATLDSEAFAREREAHIERLERELGEARAPASTAESLLSGLRGQLDEALGAGELAVAQVRELTEENAALEAELSASMICPRARCPDRDSQAELFELSGKRILCVGGVRSLIQYYRELVERRCGEFLHHDGGLEESLDAVTRALATVDVVFCSVDCVSHAACLNVKRACKHLAKPFVPLRSSGLSSFARGIQALARPATAAPASAPIETTK